MDKDQRQALEQVKAFSLKKEHFGIPADIFYGIIGASIAIGTALRSLLMIIIYLLVLGIPMYQIHKPDPFALKIWIKAVKRRHDRWCAGLSTSRELVIINKEEQ